MRLRFFDKTYDEAWLQKLLFSHPQLLPANEFDPAFAELIPITRELPTKAGPVDLVYLTREGQLALVETKLWRNPEARRKVVAQIIDYAKDMAGWSYDDLQSAVRKSGFVAKTATLIGLASRGGMAVDETQFADAVSRNLSSGRFLLLIVGDGIHEGVESMVDFLQQTPNLLFTLGLVELAIYQLDPQRKRPLIVVPRTVARTREVTRAVVRLEAPEGVLHVKIETPPEPIVPPPPMSGEEFFRELRKNTDPEVEDFARWVLAEADDHNLAIAWGKGGPLLHYVDDVSGKHFTLGQLGKTGELRSTAWLHSRVTELELPDDIWKNYFGELKQLIPRAKVKEFRTPSGQRYRDVVCGPTYKPSDNPPLKILATRKQEWFVAIDRAVEAIRKAMDERGDNG